MAFLRFVYSLLSILGAVVIGFVIFVSVVSGWKRTTSRSPAAATTRAAPLDVNALRGGLSALPVGRTNAKSRGMLVADSQELLARVDGQLVTRTRDVWIERHGREEFLVVSTDLTLRPRRDTSRHVAFLLPDGSAVKVYWVGLPDVGYVGFARFHSRPPERLEIVTVRSDSMLPAGR